MTPLLRIPITHLERHFCQGQERWTGLAELPGLGVRAVLLLPDGDGGGGWLAVRNRCPHHGVPLTKGRLDAAAGTLECPSHGWLLPLTGPDLAALPAERTECGFVLLAGEKRLLW